MNAKIINAFGRKEGDPLPGATDDKPEPCERTVKILEAYLKMAQAGDLRGVAIAGVTHGHPAFSVINSDDADIRDLSVLNLALDEMKNVIASAVFADSNLTTLEDEE
jgi:hypothetical protein